MKTRTKVIATAAALVLAIGIGTHAFKASSQERGPGFGPWFMQGVGHGMGRGMMGAGSNAAATGEMDVIHELIINHDRISRTVSNLPDGIRTVTESDDPRIAKFIKEHVASMGQRVSAGDDPNLPIESPALHAIFKNKDKITTTVETTEKGIIVVQTSADKETVVALQQHASEVTALVQDGMLAVRTAMMKNGAMHSDDMHRRMHGGTSFETPNRSGPPEAR